MYHTILFLKEKEACTIDIQLESRQGSQFFHKSSKKRQRYYRLMEEQIVSYFLKGKKITMDYLISGHSQTQISSQ